VIVSGLGRRFMGGGDKSGVSMHKEIGVALPFSSETGQRGTLIQKVVESRKKREDIDEEARILYVALTRAMDKLFLVGTVPDAEKAIRDYGVIDPGNRRMTSCYLDMAAPAFIRAGEGYEIHSRGGVFLQELKSEDSRESFKKNLAGEGELHENAGMKKFVSDRLSYEYADVKALSAKSKYSVSEITRAGQPEIREKPVPVPVFAQGGRKPAGTEIGAAIHKVMEKMDFKEAARAFAKGDVEGRRFLSELTGKLVEKIILTPEEAEAVNLKRIEMFIKSDIGKRAARAEKACKETAFNIVKEIDGIETIIQGVIDCFFEEDGEFVLIDYKSDRIASDEDIERVKNLYESQIALYGEALETIKGVKVKEKHLYMFDRDSSVLVGE